MRTRNTIVPLAIATLGLTLLGVSILGSGPRVVADEITPVPNPIFIRGDANVDGVVDIADVIDSLNFLFLAADPHCLQSHDANDDEAVDIGDPIYLATYLFAGGPAPASPFPSCGFDHTAGTLTCDFYDETNFCSTR